MLARFARAALFLATLLAASAIARPALAASAPFCDDRGATAIAAPPALEAPDVAIRRARAAACDPTADRDAWMVSIEASRVDARAFSEDPGAATVVRVSRAPAPPAVVGRRVAAVAEGASPGALERVERPPRT